MPPENNSPPRYQDPLSMAKFLEDMGFPPKLQEPSPQQDDQNVVIPKPIWFSHRDQDRDRFIIMDRIGTSPNNGGLPVYRAAYAALHNDTYDNLLVQDIFVSLKYVNIDQEPELFTNLRAQADRNGLLPDHLNLMRIRNPFIDKGCFVVVFPFMEKGSLRSIMAAKYPNGFPELCILILLREVLTGLYVIHENGHLHREINAGHIFLNGKPEIKLAYSASIYESDQDPTAENPSQYLPAVSICQWAAPPETYNNNSTNNNAYSMESDIWQFGITALELAYGGLRVESREELEAMIRKINRKRKLPAGRGDEKKRGLKKLVLSGKGFGFSEEFSEMVARCLDLEAVKRPSANEILGFGIFAGLKRDVIYFEDWMKRGGKLTNENDQWPRFNI